MNDYKTSLILQYFNTMGASYSYNELMKIFGLQEKQLDYILKKMLRDELIKLEEYIKVTEKGISILSKQNLNTIDFGHIEEKNIFREKRMDVDEIYIPEEFYSNFKSDIL